MQQIIETLLEINNTENKNLRYPAHCSQFGHQIPKMLTRCASVKIFRNELKF